MYYTTRRNRLLQTRLLNHKTQRVKNEIAHAHYTDHVVTVFTFVHDPYEECEYKADTEILTILRLMSSPLI